MRWITTLFTSAFVVLILALVNGGYVYRTQCPLPSGAIETHWTYDIGDVLPYVGRSTSAPCVSHTGTRLALSALSIAPLNSHSTSAGSGNSSDVQFAFAMSNAVVQAASIWAREQSYVRTINAKQLSSRDKVMIRREADFGDALMKIEGEVAGLRAPTDPTLRRFRTLFLRDSRLRDASRQAFIRAVGTGRMKNLYADVAKLNAQHLRIGLQLISLAKKLDRRYPGFANGVLYSP